MYVDPSITCVFVFVHVTQYQLAFPPPSPPLQGMMSHVYETVIVLVMVAVLVLGLLWVMDALTSGDTTTTSHIVVSDLYLPTLTLHFSPLFTHVYMGRAYTKMMHIELYSMS